MSNRRSRITTDVDFGREGKQFLRLPRVERGDCVYHLASDLAV